MKGYKVNNVAATKRQDEQVGQIEGRITWSRERRLQAQQLLGGPQGLDS